MPLFLDEDVFRTSIPLVVHTFGRKADFVYDLLGIEKKNVDERMIDRIPALEIAPALAHMEEKGHFLFALVSGWLNISTRFSSLKLSNISTIEKQTLFEVPGLHEKSTGLLGKRFMILMKILFVTTSALSMEQLLSVLDYKNRKTFKELYLYPLIENGLIERTIPEVPCSPNQGYVLTRRGRLFLGAFE